MIGLIGAMCAAFFNGFITDGRFMQPYNTARMLFLGVAGYLLLAAWIFSGPEIRISREACSIICWMAAFWAFTAMLAERRGPALRQSLVFGFCVWFGVFLIPGADTRSVIRMLVAVATVSASLGLLQNVGHIKLYKGIRDISLFANAGLIGNSKAHAIYLVIHVFPAAYLGIADHPLWLAGLGVMLSAIYRSKSRSAMLGLFAGGILFAFADPIPGVRLGMLAAVLIGLLFVGSLGQGFTFTESFRERRNYFRVAVRIIMEHPFFGTGFNNFAVHVPFAQRAINKETKGEFLKPQNYAMPWPELAHNEYLQWLCDCGILGCMPMLFLGGYLVRLGYQGTSEPFGPYLAAGILACLACGLTWHVSYIPAVSMTVWCWIGLLLKTQGPPWTPAIPLTVAIPGLIALCWLISQYIIREGIFRRQLAQYLMTGNREHLIRALKASPDDGQANNHASRLSWQAGKYETAYKHAMHGIEHYDGQVPLWMLLTNMGNICIQHGSLTLANAYFNEALSFLPRYQPASVGLAQLSGMTVKFSLGAQPERKAEHETGGAARGL